MLVPKQNRNRRKPNQGSDSVKHRRTRSGCYTCRSRRVKCDESRPICDRCKKGSRDCVYPETSTSSKTVGSGGGSSRNTQPGPHESAGFSSDDYEDEGEPERLEAIPDDDEELQDSYDGEDLSKSAVQRDSVGHSISGQKATARKNSETPSLIQDKGASPTPSTEGSVGYGAHQTMGTSRQQKQSVSSSPDADTLRSDWSHLPPDLQIYLTYFYENVTHLHFSLKIDSDDFLKTLFIDAALRNDALLHAVVGFAAFQRTLHNPDGKIQDFLQYYNKAVSLLLNSLKRGDKHNTGTLLAILQLATIEEFLGDWINLLGHQKAAYEILTELYTPQTIMQSQLSRVILGWYMRFDVFAGLMGGFETVLSREWFSNVCDYTEQQLIKEPANLSWTIDLAVGQLRLIAMDMSLVFAKIGKGEITFDQFMGENKAIETRLQEWKTKMDPALQDSRYLVTDFTGARPVGPEDIVDPYIPGRIYKGPLYVMNVCLIDWYSINLMHSYQTALTTRSPLPPELGRVAYETCQLYEAIEFYPGSPSGVILALQASLGIACLFLPRDERHAMFVEERTSAAKDLPSEDLRDMKAIFASLKLDDDNSIQSRNAGKGVAQVRHVSVTGGQNTSGSMQGLGGLQEADTYQPGFDHEQGYWGGGQGGGPKPDNLW
ncbi:Transcriptional regulatory moc3 [Hyphodiscus hymeniophilus]|uniref:Transcriptional regulatory moc3 n=1 Tax=Hyphodiscus hymeniophilus TaxID=353542 RepID=A0A9P6VKF9_9HELO|nr:Transcriptional regulatory moc3 [Hyphodiscus hymeniophilus]